MFPDCLKGAHLVAIESIGFALFVIDFYRPSVTTDVGNLLGLPLLAVGDEKRRTIRQVFFLVIDGRLKFQKLRKRFLEKKERCKQLSRDLTKLLSKNEVLTIFCFSCGLPGDIVSKLERQSQ